MKNYQLQSYISNVYTLKLRGKHEERPMFNTNQKKKEEDKMAKGTPSIKFSPYVKWKLRILY